ncbi:MAG TPA: zf-HC2 domain-containing protein [Bryobacteraceae bacterium]|nr:zf-HC2 domain-containing protein [Bryobacteraceae bacterium]
MDHVSAVENLTAERYLLGELSARETEEFERHYFECPECALSVSAGDIFIANARAALAQDAAAPALAPERQRPRPSFLEVMAGLWRRPAAALPFAAAAVFAVIAVYQGVIVVPGMRRALETPRALPAFELLGGSRGERSRVVVPAGTPAISLSADIPPEEHASRYRCTLSAGGRTIFDLIAPAPAAGRPVSILVPVRELRSGTYELNIRGLGAGGDERGGITYSFDFESN